MPIKQLIPNLFYVILLKFKQALSGLVNYLYYVDPDDFP